MRYSLLLLAAAIMSGQEFTRGIGVYPGDPKEDFAPVFQPDNATYRNLALRRPAYQSSAYDYNLTAQLVTDGIRHTSLPRWIASSTSQGVLKKQEREWLTDDNPVTTVTVPGKSGWVQLELAGGDEPLQVDRLDIDARLRNRAGQGAWTCIVAGSDDGQTWTELGRGQFTDQQSRPDTPYWRRIDFETPARNRFYRATLETKDAGTWTVGVLRLFQDDENLRVGGPHHFTSAWKSAGAGEEWVSVDLGAECTFDRIRLSWIQRAEQGSLQASGDGIAWRDIAALGDDVPLDPPRRARWVRVLMRRPEHPAGYILSELEVMGRGGPVAVSKPQPPASAGGRQLLSGGDWRLQRASEVLESGVGISTAGYDAGAWVTATVPATILSSYWNAGALPDPNFDDNQLTISDSFFYSDFWYRREFTSPEVAPGRRVWLNFEGINWKADVFLNNEKLGRIEGAFQRARFDITGKLRLAGLNALAVKVEKNANPGSVKEKTWTEPDKNGGILGADNPTFHASIGWDWIPTIRGRNTGIWNDVFLSVTGGVTLDHPSVTSTLPLPDTSRAEVTIAVTLHNHDATPRRGTLRGRFGDKTFTVPVSLEPDSEQRVQVPAIRLDKPRLWWPNGYGEPYLYDVQLQYGEDRVAFQAGVRQFTYSEDGGALRMWINGRRFIPRGGNWGFGESMLRYRGREHDTALRYHRDMNFNMVRNWVGMIGEEEFYEACDRHGIVVWQDFWLANPWDGPDPDDNGMFLRNARDLVYKVRSHPSIGLYCGRNEGYPPKALHEALGKLVKDEHPGIHYIGSSADDVVSGHGPYQAQPVKLYFSQRATPKMHSEMGMPNIVTYDSLQLMMKPASMWPQGAVWGIHDFSQRGAQGGASFVQRIDRSYGGAGNAAEWTTLAQFVNYEGYRAMYEAQSKHRMGLLIWMSHPCWPSQVWQTYDYYFEPTAAYFAAKKASEPLHIQWNPVTDNVEVVNYSAGAMRGLSAQAQVLNLDGFVKWEKSAALDSAEDSTATPVKVEFPAGLSAVHFIRLRLTQDGKALSENVYWRGIEDTNFRALRDLPRVELEAKTTSARQGGVWRLTTEVLNPSKTPAMMVRLKPVRAKTGDRILPALLSDNFFVLLPGERKTISIELKHADTRGEAPRIVVEGFNAGAK